MLKIAYFFLDTLKVACYIPIMQDETSERLEKLKPDLLQKSIRNYIIYKLKMNGFTVSTFAKKIGVTPQAVTNCLRSPYPRIQREIAKIIGEHPGDLWPGRYDESVKSNRRRGSQKKQNTTAPEKVNSEPPGFQNE